jgi:predicted 2-oxoglutarate/Fe(II)-dependent dioxygenase YbiX
MIHAASNSAVAPAMDARVVARLTGTLPEGGFEEGTPIYAADLPNLVNRADAPKAHREDITVGDKIVFSIENVITREEAARFIALTEGLGYRDAAPGIQTPPGMRRNKTVHWIAPADALAEIHRRIAPLLPQTLDGQTLSPRLSHRINMYRYDQGDEFNPHIDGDWPGYGLSTDGQGMVQWPNTHSKLTMLLYMNGTEDGIEGGETVLFDQGQKQVSIAPKTGRALFFRHGSNRGSVLHAGARITGKVAKYVARINVMYDY